MQVRLREPRLSHSTPPASPRLTSLCALSTAGSSPPLILRRIGAGEGIWQQLMRLSHHDPHRLQLIRGREPEVLDCHADPVAYEAARRLRAVWISHAHADHHLGLVSHLSPNINSTVVLGSPSPEVP